MDLITLGEHYCKGRIIPIYLKNNEDFCSTINATNRFKLILVKRGSGIIEVRGESIIIVSPSILCLDENDTATLINNYDLIAESIYFHPSVANTSLNFNNLRENDESMSITDIQDSVLFLPFIERTKDYIGYLDVSYSTLEAFLDLISKLNHQISNQDNDLWPCRTRSYMLEILILLNKLACSGANPDSRQLTVKNHEADNIILYLYNNLNRKITLEDLSKEFHLNRSSLNELFLKTTGSSIINYLICLRILVSSTLLRETELPIIEIIERTGFSDSTHFGRTFKKHTSSTPSEYRNKFKKAL